MTVSPTLHRSISITVSVLTVLAASGVSENLAAQGQQAGAEKHAPGILVLDPGASVIVENYGAYLVRNTGDARAPIPLCSQQEWDDLVAHGPFEVTPTCGTVEVSVCGGRQTLGPLSPGDRQDVTVGRSVVSFSCSSAGELEYRIQGSCHEDGDRVIRRDDAGNLVEIAGIPQDPLRSLQVRHAPSDRHIPLRQDWSSMIGDEPWGMCGIDRTRPDIEIALVAGPRSGDRSPDRTYDRQTTAELSAAPRRYEPDGSEGSAACHASERSSSDLTILDGEALLQSWVRIGDDDEATMIEALVFRCDNGVLAFEESAQAARAIGYAPADRNRWNRDDVTARRGDERWPAGAVVPIWAAPGVCEARPDEPACSEIPAIGMRFTNWPKPWQEDCGEGVSSFPYAPDCAVTTTGRSQQAPQQANEEDSR